MSTALTKDELWVEMIAAADNLSQSAAPQDGHATVGDTLAAHLKHIGGETEAVLQLSQRPISSQQVRIASSLIPKFACYPT